MSHDDYQSRELLWLRRLRDLSQRLGSEEDPARLPRAILEAAREMTDAERAVLVRVEGPDSQGDLKVQPLAAVGFSERDLAGPAGAVSRTVVERCLAEQRAVLTSKAEDASLLERSTLIRRGVLSVVCVPLLLGGALRGALYLDHQGREAHFRQRDLPILQAFATQAALCLELNAAPPQRASGPKRFLLGESEAISALREELARAARTPDPVLICGEPGTELALAARELHALTGDASHPFHLATAPQPGQLLGDSELPGWLGSRGTVCLEQVDTLDAGLQRVLAHAVAQGTYQPLDTTAPRSVQARIVATTHVDLAARVRDGQFLAELYYRLDVQRVVVPPLRQRAQDIPALCEAGFRRLNAPERRLDDEALESLQRYAWPGNALELERELKRLRSLGPHLLRREHLSQEIREGRGLGAAVEGFAGRTLGDMEEQMVRQAMREAKGVKSKAARKLGIPRSTLYHLLARYGVE